MKCFKVWSVAAAAYLEEIFWFYADAEDAGFLTGGRFVIEPLQIGAQIK